MAGMVMQGMAEEEIGDLKEEDGGMERIEDIEQAEKMEEMEGLKWEEDSSATISKGYNDWIF